MSLVFVMLLTAAAITASWQMFGAARELVYAIGGGLVLGMLVEAVLPGLLSAVAVPMSAVLIGAALVVTQMDTLDDQAVELLLRVSCGLLLGFLLTVAGTMLRYM